MICPGLPYYEDFELEIPVDYVEDYTVDERLGTAGRQQQQPLQNKKVPQDFSTVSGSANGEENEPHMRSHNFFITDLNKC